MDKTYYEILAVGPTATTEEIKQSHHLLQSAWHPDKFKGTNKKLAEEKFKQIEQAYGVLSDPQKRAAYDIKIAEEARRKREEEQRQQEYRRQQREAAAQAAEEQRRREEEQRRWETQQQDKEAQRKQQLKRATIVGILVPVVLGLITFFLLSYQRQLQPGDTKTVSVSAGRPWTDTGIYLAEGSTITISARGAIKFSGSDPGTTPDGAQGCKGDKTYIAPNLPCYALIGRFGETGGPVEVGANKALTVPRSGHLYLAGNDIRQKLGDNSGEWTADITLTGSSG